MKTPAQRYIKRLLRHLTQAEIAERLGVTPAAVSHWIHGVAEPYEKNIIKLKRLIKTVKI